MKKRFTTLISILFVCFFCLIAQPNAQDLRINVQVERVGNLELLPIYLHITLWNISSNSLLLPKDMDENFANYLRIEVESKTEIDTRCSRIQRVLHTIGGYEAGYVPTSPFFDLAPGKSFSLTKDASYVSGAWRPGIYKIKVIWDSSKESDRYEGYKGYAESEWIEIRIDEPTGADKAFLDKQKELWGDRYACMTLSGQYPAESAILQNMTSFYAIVSMFRLIGDPVKSYSPEKAIYAVELTRSDIGYIAGGAPWNEHRKQKFEDSKDPSRELEKWITEKGQEIINLHPDFKYIDNMKLALVLNHLALGETEEGLNKLNDLIKNGKSDVSQWASKFRELWLAKYPLTPSKTKIK